MYCHLEKNFAIFAAKRRSDQKDHLRFQLSRESTSRNYSFLYLKVPSRGGTKVCMYPWRFHAAIYFLPGFRIRILASNVHSSAASNLWWHLHRQNVIRPTGDILIQIDFFLSYKGGHRWACTLETEFTIGKIKQIWVSY